MQLQEGPRKFRRFLRPPNLHHLGGDGILIKMMSATECRVRAKTDRWICSPSWRQLFVLLLLASCPFQGTSYLVGDVVDTIVRTPDETTDALNSQMPVFGVPSTAVFPETPERLSLSFHEGLRQLPWIETMDSKKRPLKEITVTFLYSKSGDGAIHAVSSETTYDDDKSTDEGFRVRYKWVEEEEVDLQSGSIVMFLVVFVVCIIILVQSCSGTGAGVSQQDNSFGSSTPYESYGQQTNIASGMPKWD